uniref:Transposase Tc1-like domain-containing protein n=1 Tax=Sinocyclocheilus rhinocerous TaxID=307959 RepID=A0A673MB21_9TELE
MVLCLRGREVATELRVSQCVISRLQQRHRETGRVTERHRSGRPWATSHADDCFIVNNALRNRMMNATQLQAHLREVRGTRVPDHTARHRRHRLAWAKEHLRWTRNQWMHFKLH